MQCVVWPAVPDSAGPRPTIADILQTISPAGWTIVITSCTAPCTIDSCSKIPSSCSGDDSIPFDTTYLDVPNILIRHHRGENYPLTLVMDRETWTGEANNNETYPCTPFVITTNNVTVTNFKFNTDDCVAQLPNWFPVSGVPTRLFWLMSTPVIVQSDSAQQTQLRSLSFSSSSTVASGSDAVVRIVPRVEGTIIDLNGSVFSNIFGRVSLSSPISLCDSSASATPALLISVYSGTITLSSTRALTLRNDVGSTSLGAWMGSTDVESGVPDAACPVCLSKEDLHRTHVIYIIVGSVIGGIIFIVATVLVIVHLRHRLKTDQLAESNIKQD